MMMDPFDNNEEQIPEEEEEYQFILRLPPHLAAKINKAYKKKTGTNEEEEDNDDNNNNKNVDGSNNDTTNLNGHTNEDQETKDQPQKMQEEDDEDLEYWIEYDGKDYDKDSGLQDRKFIFYYGEEQYDAILMDLPTITESYKTLDNKNLYKKQHLVPFGEYIPFLPKLRGLIQFFELPMSNVSHGGINQEKFSILDNIEVATPICFDIAFAKTVRKINKSSKIMINISNDTWFGDSIGPHQHLSITRIRALENNRWVIRATNDGISGIIDNKGTIVDILDKGKKGLLNGNVNLVDHQSIYNKFGYMIVGVVSFIFILILFIMRICKNLY